jgi:Gamma tubulin complex component C-terminal
VKRSKYAIEATVRVVKSQKQPNSPPTRPSLHYLHLLRAKLLHFVNNLQHYLFNRVLQTGWDEFMQGMNSAVDLDDLVQKHSIYVTKIFNQCLLNIKVSPRKHYFQFIYNYKKLIFNFLQAAPVLSVIKRILNMSLRFSSNFIQYENFHELSSDTSLQPHQSTTQLHDTSMLDNILQEFKVIDTYVSQQVSLLVSILQDIVAQKNLPHLMDLLLRLNYNQYYRAL